MPALTADQRAAVLAKYGGWARTYFSTGELRAASFAYQGELTPSEVEFYSYLRLASVLEAGSRLPDILHRITLAPSLAQERNLEVSRGQLRGQLDVRAYMRRYGQKLTPPIFPTRRVHSTYNVPENVLASVAAYSLLIELQLLTARLPIQGAAEGARVRELVDALEQLLRDPSLGEVAATRLPEISSAAVDPLFWRVDERLRTRRISNRAYWELWRWTNEYRRRGLTQGEWLVGLAYSEEFDDRLFEIFVLAAVRDALTTLGFYTTQVRPLHERKQRAVLEVQHPESGLGLSVFFQRAERVLWSDDMPREWEGLIGIPDILLQPRSLHHPVIVLDAKNRYRGADFEVSIAEEAYKMLGYFQNFAARLRVHDHGPLGGLVFVSRDGSEASKLFTSRSGGVLWAITLDPCAGIAPGQGALRTMLEGLLQSAALLGGNPDVENATRELKENAWAVAGQETEAVEEEILRQLHDLTAAQYGQPGAAIERARQDLALHLLGTIWTELDSDVQRLLATGEVFWTQHHLALGMDFAPVVGEISRAVEILLDRLLFTPFRRWAADRGLPSGKSALTLGEMRVMVDDAKLVAGGAQRKGQLMVIYQALDTFLTQESIREYAYGALHDDLDVVNQLRRKAAHKDVITGAVASEFRDKVLGVGDASPILPRMVRRLRHVQE